MVISRWTILAALALALLLVGGTVGYLRDHRAASGESYTHESLSQVLNQSGIKTMQAAPSNFYAHYGLPPDSSYLIATEQGAIDVIFFPTPVADRLSVREVGEYQWEVVGLGEGRAIGSNHQLYFILHGNMIIQVDDHLLYDRVKGALDR